MTTQLKWRLSKLPTVDELLKLVSDKIITQEEAKEILFNKETESERDIESYKQEIKFLKEVIEKLGSRNQIVEVVREYVPHYINTPFIQPYGIWCGSSGITAGGNTQYYATCSSGGTQDTTDNAILCSFSSIVS